MLWNLLEEILRAAWKIPMQLVLRGLFATSTGHTDSNVVGGLPFIMNGDDLMSSVDLHVD